MTRPNNVATNYAYDNLSRLQSVLHQLAGSTIDGATYTLDNAGNRTAKTDQRTAVATSYAYDNIYQLLSATPGSGTAESYTYDPVGNRLTSAAGSSAYNSSNEITSSPSASFTYDNNGNTLTSTTGSNTTSYAWDFENRLTSVTLPGSGGTVSFSYDPFGRRIKKSSSSGTSIYLYDGPNVAEEVDQSGNALARYVQDSGVDQVRAELRSGATSYYEADGLGTVTSLSNASGALAQTYTFDSFGNQTASSGSLTNPYRYTAREFDSETNLYYNRARYYDPSLGRFLSEDPKRFQANVNFYSYVSNSPIIHLDPFGWSKCKSGACADCPGGKWVSGALTFEAYGSAGVASVGGLVFAGVFMCTSNPSFNLPFYTVCGFGSGGLSPRPPLTSPPKKLFGGGAGAGGAIVRCTGATCREDMEGPETGGFVQVGPFYGFKEGGASGVSCYGGGGGFDFGLSLGGFKCTTQVGKSWTF
jgi:RHS repeat-associated protein